MRKRKEDVRIQTGTRASDVIRTRSLVLVVAIKLKAEDQNWSNNCDKRNELVEKLHLEYVVGLEGCNVKEAL